MTGRKWLTLTAAALAAVLLAAAGCGQATQRGPHTEAVQTVRPAARGEVDSATTARMGEDSLKHPAAEPAPGEPGGSLNAFDRMIIRQGHLSLAVESTDQALARIRQIAAASGGFVSEVSTHRRDGQLFASLTLRIPAQSFDQTLEQLKDVAQEVRSESVSGRDVTEEFIDLTARLRNLEATEAELLALLTEVRQSLRSVDQVLIVHRELMRVREEIERIEGRRQFLQNAADLATLSVELVPLAAAAEQPRAGWQPAETVAEALAQLTRALARLGDAAIWLVLYVLPLLGLVALPVAGLVWIGRRLLAGRAAA